MILGLSPETPHQACQLASMPGPWKSAYQICLDSATEVPLRRREIYGFRIEDRHFEDETWYLVSAYFSGDLSSRLWNLALAPAVSPSQDPNGANISTRDKSYAVVANGELTLVAPAIAIGDFPCVVAATRELSQAEALAHAWEVPVERVISAEIASQPSFDVSLVQLLVAPRSWFGKRIAVRGYLSSPWELYLSREHSEVFDWASAITVRPPTSDQGITALEACVGNWVSIEAFVDSDRGAPVLTRLERVYAVSPNGPECWPLAPAIRP
jgi:hypothetical protein